MAWNGWRGSRARRVEGSGRQGTAVPCVAQPAAGFFSRQQVLRPGRRPLSAALRSLSAALRSLSAARPQGDCNALEAQRRDGAEAGRGRRCGARAAGGSAASGASVVPDKNLTRGFPDFGILLFPRQADQGEVRIRAERNRNMKRLSVRLAAGAAVILLGALAVAQAQRDRQRDADAGWDLSAGFEAEQGNAPLAAEDAAGDWPAPPDTAIYRGNESPALAEPPPVAPGGVQLASHDQPLPDEAADSSAAGAASSAPQSSLGMPTGFPAPEESPGPNETPSAAPEPFRLPTEMPETPQGLR